MIDALLIAAVTGMVSGLVTWGGLAVKLEWLRRDVDRAHVRLDTHDERLQVLKCARQGD